MSTQKIITSTHYNRPFCTQSMIDRLYKCKGIEGYKVLFFVEPGNQQVIDIINNCSLNKEVVINDKVLGLWVNKKKCVSYGFTQSDYIIHLEDDILLGSDALIYFEWGNETFRDNKEICSITAYNHIDDESYKIFNDLVQIDNKVSIRSWYHSSSWAMWKDRFDILISENWSGRDYHLLEILCINRKMCEIYPHLPRCRNIGHLDCDNNEIVKLDENTTKGRDVEYYKKMYFTAKWSEDMVIEKDFFEVIDRECLLKI